MEDKQSSRIKATLNYPNGPVPRAELIKDNVGYKPTFQAKDSSDEERARVLKEASEYASELQRESRGKKKGGKIGKVAKSKSASSRADGIAKKGHTKGRIC